MSTRSLRSAGRSGTAADASPTIDNVSLSARADGAAAGGAKRAREQQSAMRFTRHSRVHEGDTSGEQTAGTARGRSDADAEEAAQGLASIIEARRSAAGASAGGAAAATAGRLDPERIKALLTEPVMLKLLRLQKLEALLADAPTDDSAADEKLDSMDSPSEATRDAVEAKQGECMSILAQVAGKAEKC